MKNFINRLLIILHYIYFFCFPIYLIFYAKTLRKSDVFYEVSFSLPLIFLFFFIRYCLTGQLIIFPWSNLKESLEIQHRNYFYFIFDFLHFSLIYFSVAVFCNGLIYGLTILHAILAVISFFLGGILKFLFFKQWEFDPFIIEKNRDKELLNVEKNLKLSSLYTINSGNSGTPKAEDIDTLSKCFWFYFMFLIFASYFFVR